MDSEGISQGVGSAEAKAQRRSEQNGLAQWRWGIIEEGDGLRGRLEMSCDSGRGV